MTGSGSFGEMFIQIAAIPTELHSRLVVTSDNFRILAFERHPSRNEDTISAQMGTLETYLEVQLAMLPTVTSTSVAQRHLCLCPQQRQFPAESRSASYCI